MIFSIFVDNYKSNLKTHLIMGNLILGAVLCTQILLCTVYANEIHEYLQQLAKKIKKNIQKMTFFIM